jgi:hypothetical protein
MKAKNIAYWITTIVVAFFLGGGGAAQVARVPGTVDGFVRILHYPAYFVPLLGVWKVLGAIAILAPLIIAVVAMASWALRPASRIIGTLMPTRNGEAQ